MVIEAHPHVGDVHRIYCQVRTAAGVAIPLVGPITIRLQRPDTSTEDFDGTLVGDGSAGEAYYDTAEDDLDLPGTWFAQLKDADGPWHPNVAEFTVMANLPEPGSP